MLTIFFALCSALQLFFLVTDVINRKTGNCIKDIIWLVVSVCLTIGYFYAAKNFGTSKMEEDDERDKFIQSKTNNQAFNILQWVLFISGGVVEIFALILAQNGIDSRTIIIFIIASVLLFLWTFSWILQMILLIINYLRN